jgi:hypothetical protein
VCVFRAALPCPVIIAHAQARRAVKKALATACAAELAAAYASAATPAAFSIEGPEMARRAFRNLALDYLNAAEGPLAQGGFGSAGYGRAQP